jgi:hypothetical protein
MSIDTVVEQVHRLLLDNLPVRASRTPSGWVTFNCPMCNDTRKRAGIIVSGPKISYHCFNCRYVTGWSPHPYLSQRFKDLAVRLGVEDTQIHAVQLELLKHSDELETQETEGYVYTLSKFPLMELPESVVMVEDLPDEHEVKQYAKDRGIYGLYPLLWFDDDPLYAKRLVIPFTYNGDLIGWTGRHVAPPDKSTPKYLHKLPPGYVFNVDRFADSKRDIVIVVEGCMDAIHIDGVAIMGNHVTAEQAHLITRLGKRIILCPDRDKAGQELIEQALALDWEVSFPPWANDVKDAADAANKYGRLLTVASIIKHATANKVKSRVKAKML